MAISQASSGRLIAITPHDTNAVSETRGVFVGTGGSLVCRGVQSQTNVTFANVPDGTLLPIRVDRVLATGTTATGIVGLL
jgi:hypothetical protein